jgi:aryl-alcohol dehydrogenase-like predicted oxidoreductase
MITADERRRIVFGCGNFGGLGSSPDLRDKGDGRERALGLLDHARAIGLTRFDTANTYGGGVSETVLGEWLGRQDKAFRSSIQVATKVGNPNGCPPSDRPLSRAEVAHHLDESLRRLGVERIDLYYMHEFDPATPLDETLEAFDRALASGKIAAFGVSNATRADLQGVLALTGGPLRAAFTHVQNEFNLLQQRDLADVIPLAIAEGLDYVAFSPLAGGLLSGKYRADAKPDAGRVRDAPGFYDHLLTPETFATIDALKARAEAADDTVPGAALRFILETPGVGSLIIAPRSIEQFEAYGIVA